MGGKLPDNAKKEKEWKVALKKKLNLEVCTLSHLVQTFVTKFFAFLRIKYHVWPALLYLEILGVHTKKKLTVLADMW